VALGQSVVSWVPLIGMNVGGATTVTLTMTYPGLIGSGIIGIIIIGGGNLETPKIEN
jgi:hypothetical protein